MRPEIAGESGKGKGARRRGGRREGRREREREREMLSSLTSERISTGAAVKANNEVIL